MKVWLLHIYRQYASEVYTHEPKFCHPFCGEEGEAWAGERLDGGTDRLLYQIGFPKSTAPYRYPIHKYKLVLTAPYPSIPFPPSRLSLVPTLKTSSGADNPTISLVTNLINQLGWSCSFSLKKMILPSCQLRRWQKISSWVYYMSPGK